MTESLIQGIHHVSLKPAGKAAFDRTVAFYHETLGLPILRAWGEGDSSGAMLDTGSGIIEINADGKGEQTGGAIHHFALATRQVDTVVAAVRAAGYPITVEPADGALPTEPPYRVRMAFCKGPCGEVIELFDEK